MARKVGLTRDDVIDAAEALADREGLGAVTLAAIAKSLGVRSPSLYAHVDGLGGVRRALAMRGAHGLREMAAASVDRSSAETSLAALSAGYRRYATEHPGLYQASQVGAPDPVADPELYRALIEPVEVVASVIDAWGLRGDAAIHAIRAWRAGMHGFVVLERDGGFGLSADIEDSFDTLVATLTAGIAARAARGAELDQAE